MERLEWSSHVSRGATFFMVKSSFTGAANREMEDLLVRLQAVAAVGHAMEAFSEQGAPALRDVMAERAQAGFGNVRILPCPLSMKPGFRMWSD